MIDASPPLLPSVAQFIATEKRLCMALVLLVMKTSTEIRDSDLLQQRFLGWEHGAQLISISPRRKSAI